MIKILYVEDNDDNVYMLKMRLELLNEFEIAVAENVAVFHGWEGAIAGIEGAVHDVHDEALVNVCCFRKRRVAAFPYHNSRV